MIFRCFYDRKYYVEIYNNWTIKKARLMLLLFSFILSLFVSITLLSTFNKYSDVVFLNSFFSGVPYKWDIQNGVGLSIYDKQNNEINNFENQYFKIDLKKNFININDFGERNIFLTKTNLAIKIDKNIKYFPLSDFRQLGPQFSSMILSIRFDNQNNKIAVFNNNIFARNFDYSQIGSYVSKMLSIFKFIMFIVFTPFIFGMFYFMFFITSKIYVLISTKIGLNLDSRRLFITFVPTMFIYLVLFIISKRIFHLPIFIINFIVSIYTFLISFIFLKDKNL